MVALLLLFVVISGCISEEIKFIWRIENFDASPYFYSGEPFRSPWFSAGNPRHSVWYLELYSNVTSSQDRTLQYKLQSIVGSQPGNLICELTRASFSNKTVHWGAPQDQLFIHEDAMLQGTLNLRCCLNFKNVPLHYDVDFTELSQNFIRMYESKNYSDITLHTSDREFFLHKFLLRKRAPKLCEDLELQCSIMDQDRVKVEKISTPVLQTLLQYIYSGTLNAVSEENLPELYEVLEKYKFEEFINEIMYLKSPATITTRINVVRRNIYWNIEVKNQFRDKNYLYKYIHFDFARFVIIIFFTTDDQGTWIHIRIKCISSPKEHIIMSCITTLWFEGVELYQSPEKTLRFSTKNGDKENILQKLFCSKKVATGRTVTLQFNTAISNGDRTSSVESLILISPEPQSILGMGTLSHHLNEIFYGIDNYNRNISLNIEKDIGDVELRFEDGTLRAHKAVLATWSPVLSSILQTNIVNNISDKVEISGVDINTARRMLKSMYSGYITRGEYADDVRLYAAADEYQMSSLFRKCSKYLVWHLSLDNACNVLELADNHVDYSLLDSAQRFITSNRDEILSSKKWFSLVIANPELASRVLKYISISLGHENVHNSFNSKNFDKAKKSYPKKISYENHQSHKSSKSQFENFYSYILDTFTQWYH